MRAATRTLLLGGMKYKGFIQSISPSLWYKFNETSGSVAVNYGSLVNGSELITNGTFTTDTGWTKGTGWTISDNVAHADLVGGSNLTQIADPGIVAGNTYLVTYTILNYVSGGISTRVGSTTVGTTRSSNGTFTEILTASGTSVFMFAGGVGMKLDIDNVSVKQTYNGIYTSATLAQTGKISATDAVLYDGANTKLQVPSAPPFSNSAVWSIAVLFKPSGLGEPTAPHLLALANAYNSNDIGVGFNNNLGLLFGRVYNTTPTTAVTLCSSGVSQNVWSWIFVNYDDTGDRKMHFYVGVNGVVTEASYTAQPALTGTYKTSSNVVVVGNTTGQGNTVAGNYDEFMAFSKVLTTSQMQQIVRLTGV